TLKTVEFLLNSNPDPALLPKFYCLKAQADFTMGDYESALKNAFSAKHFAEKFENKNALDQSLIIISEVLSFLQLENEAEEISRKLSGSPSASMFQKRQKASKQDPESSIFELKKIISV